MYKHFISLGYFCSVAMELERTGLRSTSSPFDWCISNMEGVIMAIRNNFTGFLDRDLLYQSDSEPRCYFNKKHRIWFMHDFNKYEKLDNQLEKVKSKYERRIKRFYQDIQEPTLFIRYISDEIKGDSGKSEELEYIIKNQELIIKTIKEFNDKNDIIYIANNEVYSDTIKIYNVEKDENDVVARHPLDKNEKLRDLLYSFNFKERSQNLKIYQNKLEAKKRKKTFPERVTQKLKGWKEKYIYKEYVHSKKISGKTK